jgi:maltose-binding protein MalE
VRRPWVGLSASLLVSAGMLGVGSPHALASGRTSGPAITHVRAAPAKQDLSVTPPRLRRGVTIRVLRAPLAEACLAPCVHAVHDWENRTGDHVVQEFGDPASFCVDAPKKNAPDLIVGPHDQIGVQVGCNALAPIPSWAWPASSQTQYITSAVRAATFGGKRYFMPTFAQTTGIFYNTATVSASLFKPAKGDRYPRWSALVARAKALTTGQTLGFVGGLELYPGYAFLRAFGGYVFRSTKTGYNYHDIGLASPGAIEGLQFLKDLTTSGKYKLEPPTMDGRTAEAMFAQGRAAMLLDGPWEGPSLAGTLVRSGFAPLPSIDGLHPMHPFVTYSAYAVNAYSMHKNEAFSFLAYVTRRVQQLEEPSNNPEIPVLKSLLRAQMAHADAFTAAEAAAVATGDPMPDIPEMSYVWVPFDAAITAATKGQSTPEAAAHEAVTEIQAAIAKAHGG